LVLVARWIHLEFGAPALEWGLAQLSSFGAGECDLDRWSPSHGHGDPFDAGEYTNQNAP